MPTYRALPEHFLFRESSYTAVVDHYEDAWVQHSKKIAVKMREDDTFNADVQKVQSSGMTRFRKFRETWKTGFKWKAEGFQCYFQSCITQLFAPILLGTDWDVDGPGLIREMGWTSVKQGLLGITARRMGKSVIVSQGATLLTIFVEDNKIVIMSTGKRTSGALKTQCRNNLAELGVNEPLITLDNQETLAVKMPDFMLESKIFSLPAGEEVTHITLAHIFIWALILIIFILGVCAVCVCIFGGEYRDSCMLFTVTATRMDT